MTEDVKRIPFEEFSDNLISIFARVLHDHETILVESKHGELVEVKPVPSTNARSRGKTKEDYEAFLASAGGWADFDADAFLKANEESRGLSTRPPAEL